MSSVSVGFSYGAQWRMYGGGSWSVSWTNNTGSPVYINSVSLIMGTGSTGGSQIWSSSGLRGPFSGSPMTVTCTTSIGGSTSVSVGSVVSMASSGSSTSSTGWFNNASQTYTWSFGGLNLSNGSTVTFTLSVSSSGGAVSVRRSGGYTADIAYTVASHTVYFIDGLTGGTISVQTVNDGGSASAPGAPSHTGYTFGGWSGDYSYVTSDRTITATYHLTPYTIVFNGQGGSVSPTSKTVYYNNAVGTLASASRTAYNFVGWFTGTGGSGSQYTSSTIYPYTSNITLYAYWTPITYSISYLAGDNAMSPAIMPYNPPTYNVITATFTLNNPTRIGYTFIGWTGNGISTPTTSMQVPTGTYGNLTFTANWRAQLEKDSGGTWGHGAVAYHFDGSNWLAVDTKSFNGSSWNKLP